MKCNMTHKEISRKGGQSRSAKKLRAVRQNIRKATAARMLKFQQKTAK